MVQVNFVLLNKQRLKIEAFRAAMNQQILNNGNFNAPSMSLLNKLS